MKKIDKNNLDLLDTINNTTPKNDNVVLSRTNVIDNLSPNVHPLSEATTDIIAKGAGNQNYSEVIEHYEKYVHCLKDITGDNINMKQHLKHIIKENSTVQNTIEERAQSVMNSMNNLSTEQQDVGLEFCKRLYSNLQDWDINGRLSIDSKQYLLKYYKQLFTPDNIEKGSKMAEKLPEKKELMDLLVNAFDSILRTSDLAYLDKMKIAYKISETLAAMTTSEKAILICIGFIGVANLGTVDFDVIGQKMVGVVKVYTGKGSLKFIVNKFMGKLSYQSVLSSSRLISFWRNPITLTIVSNIGLIAIGYFKNNNTNSTIVQDIPPEVKKEVVEENTKKIAAVVLDVAGQIGEKHNHNSEFLKKIPPVLGKFGYFIGQNVSAVAFGLFGGYSEQLREFLKSSAKDEAVKSAVKESAIEITKEIIKK